MDELFASGSEEAQPSEARPGLEAFYWGVFLSFPQSSGPRSAWLGLSEAGAVSHWGCEMPLLDPGGGTAESLFFLETFGWQSQHPQCGWGARRVPTGRCPHIWMLASNSVPTETPSGAFPFKSQRNILRFSCRIAVWTWPGWTHPCV